MIRRRPPSPPVPPELKHYLERGCYLWHRSEPAARMALDLFMLALRTARAVHSAGGTLDPLREAWRVHGAAVKASHAGETFAEAVLAGQSTAHFRCRDHGE